MFKLVRATVSSKAFGSGTVVRKYPTLLLRRPFSDAITEEKRTTATFRDKTFLRLFQENFAAAENKLNEDVASGNVPSNFVYAKLFNELGERVRNKEDFSDKVRHYLKQMRSHNVQIDTRIYNNILSYYSKRNDSGEVFRLVQRMRKENVRPDHSTYSEILKTLAYVGDMNGLVRALMEMKTVGLEPDDVNYTLIMESFASHGRYDLLDTIWKAVRPTAGLQNWSVMITSYGWRNMIPELKQAFEDAISEGWEKIGLYTAVISAAMRHHHCELAEQFYRRMIDVGIEPGLPIISSMMNGYGGVGKFDDIERMFEELDKYHLQADGKLLSTCIRHAGMFKRPDLVERYWDIIVNKHKHEAEARDYLRVSTAYIKTGDLEKAITLFRESIPKTPALYLAENFRIFISALLSAKVDFPLREQAQSLMEVHKTKKIYDFLDTFAESLKK